MFRREVWTLPNECLRQTRVGASQASHALEIRAVWRRLRLVGARSWVSHSHRHPTTHERRRCRQKVKCGADSACGVCALCT